MLVLQTLNINMQTYGENKGQYIGTAKFQCDEGTVEVRIGHGHAHRILEICSDAIIRQAEKVADAMIAPLIEAEKQPPEFIKIGATHDE